jgi:pimeloyl-ACP methyl ester carboxylesterase
MTAPPVVLIHGFASHFEHEWRRTGWVDILEAEGRTVQGVDLPGHGTAAQLASTRVEAVLVAVGNGPVDAVGFSAGGHALLVAAAHRPEAFRRVALLGVGSRPVAANVLAGDLESDEEPEDQFSRLIWRLAERSGNDRRLLARSLRTEIREEPDPERLRRLDVPVLLVVGDQDLTGSGEELASMLPRARRVVLAGVDHFGTLGDVRCIEAVVDFLMD